MTRVSVASAIVVGSVVIATVGVVGLVVSSPEPLVAFSAIVAVVLLFVCVVRPVLAARAAILVAATALPAAIPTSFALGGFTVYAYEPFLWITALAAAIYLRRRRDQLTNQRLVWWALAMFAIAVAGSMVVGLVRGFDVRLVIGDHREVVNLFLGFIAMAGVGYFASRRTLLRTLLASLWISSVMLILSSTTGLALSGRSEVAQLYSTSGELLGGASTAVRLLSPATFPAVATLCVALSLVILGAARATKALPFIAPSVIIIFLGFSRNNLLAVAVTLGVSCLLALVVRRGVKAMVRASLVIGVIAALAFGAVSASASSGNWLTAQVEAYSSRVIEGLTGEQQASDTSTQDREAEDRYMLTAIGAYSIVGTGAGYAYKPASGPIAQFAASGGQYYAHNYYLWIAMKAGWLGIASLAALIFCALASAVIGSRGGRVDQVAFAAGLSGFLVTMTVAPLPNGSPTALVFGVVLAGAAIGWPALDDQRKKAEMPVDPVSLEGVSTT